MLSPSTFQYEGHSWNMFHLKNIQKDVTVNSDLERRKNVVFAWVDLNNQDISSLIELLLYLVNQYSNSEMKDKFHDF